MPSKIHFSSKAGKGNYLFFDYSSSWPFELIQIILENKWSNKFYMFTFQIF